jgi:fructokinase
VAGAPLHVAVHFAAAGWHSMLWSRIGADPDGARIRATLDEYHVDTILVQEDETTPTGTVHIDLPDEGEHSFTIREPAAWDHIELVGSPPAHDVFHYGSLAARHPISASTLWQALDASPAPLRIFDVNLRPPFDDLATVQRGLEYATLVKMNADEFERIRHALGTAENPSELFRRYDQLSYVCVTRGGDGAELHTRDAGSEQIIPEPVEPVDTVGAGDAFVAGLAVALATGETPLRALQRADEVARSVLTVRGGLPS